MEEIDAKYEFNAPKYIDFTKDEGDDDDADEWFEQREGDEGGIPEDLVPYYEAVFAKNGYENATTAITAAIKNDFSANQETVEKQQPETAENIEKKVRIKQERISYAETNEIKNTSSVMNIKIKQERKSHIPDETKYSEETPNNCNSNCISEYDNTSPAKADNKQSQNESAETSEESDKQSPNNTATSHDYTSEDVAKVEEEPRLKPRKSNIRRSWNSPSVDTTNKKTVSSLTRSRTLRKSTRNNSINYSDTKKRKTASVSDSESVLAKKVKPLVRPETPSFVRKLRERGSKAVLSTEAVQISKMKEMQKKTRAQMKRNDQSLKNVLKGELLPSKVHSICPLTKPKEFSFATNDRLKEHGMQTRADSSKPFESQLRQHPPSPTFKKGPTKPKPFQFHASEKPVEEQQPGKKWTSMAQFAMNFQTKTPERFRSKAKRDDSFSKANEGFKKNPAIHVTHPKTPNLTTKTRNRPVTALSAHDIEEQEVEEMKQYQFKATEFNRKIVEKQGMYGVKQMPETHTTQAKPFHFESDSRINQRKHKLDDSGNDGNQGTHSSKHGNNSINSSKHDGAGGKLKKTEVKPFSFESRDKERQLKKEEKIKEVLLEEERMREFHARPMPSSSPDTLPVIQSKPATNPAPFKISHGSQAYQQKFKEKLQNEEEEDKMKRKFKAQDSIVTKKVPFKPVAGLLPTTNAKDFNFHSDTRAKERAKFEEWKHENERALEEEKKRIEKEREMEELKEIKQLRKEAVPKSHPIRNYKPVEIHKNVLPVTQPVTPNFHTGQRKRSALRN